MTRDTAQCIAVCTECANQCRSCATDCRILAVPGLDDLARICDECATSCDLTVQDLRQGSHSHCLPSAMSAERCAVECDKFDYEFTRKCSKACRAFASSCHEFVDSVPATLGSQRDIVEFLYKA